jgi:hypothetical protein
MNNAINWFEIPAVDLERAITFYSTVLGVQVRRVEFMGRPEGYFPADEKAVGGAIVKRDQMKPSTTGPLVYINAGSVDKLDKALTKVEAAGGKIEMGKTSIGDPGYIALIIDTEGNRVGLHSPNGTT